MHGPFFIAMFVYWRVGNINMYIYIPGTCECPLFVALAPSKTRSFPIKVRVICVPGRYDICISIGTGINISILIVFMIDILISVRLLGSDFLSRSLISKKDNLHCSTVSTAKAAPGSTLWVPPNHFYHLFSGRCERWHQRETTGTLGKKPLPSIQWVNDLHKSWIQHHQPDGSVPKMAQILWEKPHGFKV